MTSFALIGAAGYVAPRHMRAIKAIGGDLRVAFDPNDSVGVLDSYFPDASFFVEFERFDRHVDKLRRGGQKIDYVSICSPNYLHDAHCRFAMRSDADAICEKPLVLNLWNIDGLEEVERQTGRRVFTILQLRLHPAVQAMKAKVAASTNKVFKVDLTYVAPRGRWYHVSWKGDESKSGGVATNIGVHLFDMLSYVFGPMRRSIVHLREQSRVAGYLECGRAEVRWFISVDATDLPEHLRSKKITYRSIVLDSEKIELSDGFTDLHTASYREIIENRGFRIDQIRHTTEVLSAFRTAKLKPCAGDRHDYLRDKKSLSR
jgi:UDP-N-acetyl-2-amino-2-deoxyglucuronate dehydrogenase